METTTLISIATTNSAIHNNELTLFLRKKTLTRNGFRNKDLHSSNSYHKLVIAAMELYKDSPTPITEVIIEII